MLPYYAWPGPLTQTDKRLVDLPRDVALLCPIIHGMMLHPVEAREYGTPRLARPRWKELELREVSAMLDQLEEVFPAPLDQQRPPSKRLLGNCRHFACMLCAMLRAHRIPARVRYGFATYFHPGFFTDHVLCEYWSDTEHRWVRVDAMLDSVLRQKYQLHLLNPLDVGLAEFLLAGEVWREYRIGRIAATLVGLDPTGPRGQEFIREGILHDIASLNKMEPLCQDQSSPENMALADPDWDQLAAWTCNPDGSFPELQKMFRQLIRHVIP